MASTTIAYRRRKWGPRVRVPSRVLAASVRRAAGDVTDAPNGHP